MAEFNVDIIGAIIPPEYAYWYETMREDEEDNGNGRFYTTSNNVKKAIKGATAGDTIYLRINSEGGSVVEGHYIMSLLRQTGARLVADIQSLAASEAMYMAVACDEVRGAYQGMCLIHNVSTYAGGTQYELTSAAKTAADFDDILATTLANKCGKPKDYIMEKYLHGKSDVTLTMDEAKAEGFVDDVYNTPTTTTQTSNGTAQVDNAIQAFFALGTKEAKQQFANTRITNFRNIMAKQTPPTPPTTVPDNTLNIIEPTLAEAQQAVLTYKNQLEAKDEEITTLNATINQLNNDLVGLKKEIAENSTEAQKATNVAVLEKEVLARKVQDLENSLHNAMVANDIIACIAALPKANGLGHKYSDIVQIKDAFLSQYAAIKNEQGGYTFVEKVLKTPVNASTEDVVKEYCSKHYAKHFKIQYGNGGNSLNGSIDNGTNEVLEKVKAEASREYPENTVAWYAFVKNKTGIDLMPEAMRKAFTKK